MNYEKLKITERELKEITLALYYAKFLAHGTTGHNQLMLIAKLAIHLGFDISQPTTEDGKSIGMEVTVPAVDVQEP